MTPVPESRKAVVCIMLAVTLMLSGAGLRDMCFAAEEAPAGRLNNLFHSAIAYGTAENSIGTFGGWTIWLGWDGSFSENYDPFSETYAWVVYFAPEGIFVALQWADSNYSNVDMYAAYDYFYGVLQSPFGAVLPRSFVDSLNGITLSIDAFDTSMAPVGALSHVSFAVSSAQTVFRTGSLKTLQRGIQYGAGLNASFALLPFSLPFGVSLDHSSGVEAGFYPVVLWDLDGNAGVNPVDQIVGELETRATAGDDSFPGLYEKEIAGLMIPFMQSLPSSEMLQEFMQSPGKNSHIDRMLDQIGLWLRTGDTGKLPGGVDMPMAPSQQYETMRPVRAITDACFELAYEHAYKSTSRDDTVYADCIVTVQCTPGDNCTVEVTSEEIAGLVPGSQPEDFEGVWVGFDLTPEEFLVYETEDGMGWTTIEDGTASTTFVNNTDTPFLMGVQVWPDPATDDKTLELCRRKVVFDEAFAVPEVDYGEIAVDEGYDDTACPVARTLGPDYRKTLDMLRSFRDRVLGATPEGKELIDAYYRLGSAVWQVLERNPVLRKRCRTLLFQAVPIAAAYLEGDVPAIPQELPEAIARFIDDLAAAAPPGPGRRIGHLRQQAADFQEALPR